MKNLKFLLPVLLVGLVSCGGSSDDDIITGSDPIPTNVSESGVYGTWLYGQSDTGHLTFYYIIQPNQITAVTNCADAGITVAATVPTINTTTAGITTVAIQANRIREIRKNDNEACDAGMQISTLTLVQGATEPNVLSLEDSISSIITLLTRATIQ